MFTNFNSSCKKKKQLNSFLDYGKYLMKFILLVIVISSIVEGVSGNDDISTEKRDDICPCLPMDKCPRIYGQSALDIRELGFLKPCHKYGTVRCCGVTIRIEHEKDDERNQGIPITPLKETYDKESSLGETKNLNNKENKYDESLINVTTNSPGSPVGGGESWSTGSNPITKFRRRKVKGKGITLTKPSISTGGGSLGSESAIRLNSSISEPYSHPSPSSSNAQIPSRPRIAMRKKIKTKVTEEVPEKTDTALNSMTQINSGTSTKLNPVFNRVRKPLLKVGVKVETDLPGKLSLSQGKESAQETVPALESINSKNLASTQSQGKPILELGINVDQQKIPSSSSSSSESINATKLYAKNQGTETITSSINRPLSRVSNFRNNSFASNRMRPNLLNKKTGSYANVTHITPESNAEITGAQNSRSKVLDESKREPDDNTNSGVVKLRRPARPNLRRRPLSPSQLKLSPQNPHETSHSATIFPESSDPLLPQSPETSVVRIGAESGISPPPAPKFRKRVKILKTSTTTTTPQYSEFSESDYVTTTPQPPTPPHNTQILNKQENEGSLYPDVYEKVETIDHQWTHTKEQESSDHAYKGHDNIPDQIPIQQTRVTPSSEYVEPQIISSNRDQNGWTEYTINNSHEIHHEEEPLPSILKISKPQFHDSQSKQPEKVDAYDKEEKVSKYQQIPNRKSPIHVSTSSAYTKVRNGQDTTPIQTDTTTTPSRRFKVPTNFHFKSPVTETVPVSPIRNSYVLEEDNTGSDGENYDLTLDKESREQLKGVPMTYDHLPLNNDYYHSQYTESIPYGHEENVEDRNSPYHSFSYGEDEEMEEETRIHVKFVEKTNNPSSFNYNVNKTEYHRTSVQKPEYDTRRIPTGSATLSSKVNSPARMTIIKSQKVEQIPVENDFNKGEATFSLASSHTPSKRIKARIPFRSTTSTTTPPTTSDSYSTETLKFNFPPFNSLKRGSTGATSTTTTTIPPPPAVKIQDFQQTTTNFTARPRIRMTSKLFTTTQNPSYIDAINSNQEEPTEPYRYYQVVPTEPPPTTTTTIQPSTPEPIKFVNELSIRNNPIGHSSLSLKPLKPTTSKSSRFAVPKIFNFTNIHSPEQNPEPKFKFPTEQTREQPSSRTPVVDIRSEFRPQSNHISTFHSLESGLSSLQIIQNGNNDKDEFESQVKEVYPTQHPISDSKEKEPNENHHNLHLDSNFNNLQSQNPISNSNTPNIANLPQMQTQVNINNPEVSSGPLPTQSPNSQVIPSNHLKMNLSFVETSVSQKANPNMPPVDLRFNSHPSNDFKTQTFTHPTQVTVNKVQTNLIRPTQPQLTGFGPQASIQPEFVGQSKPPSFGLQQSFQQNHPQPLQSLPTPSKFPGYHVGTQNQYSSHQGGNYQGTQTNLQTLSGSVTQGGKVTPVSIQAQIMTPTHLPPPKPYTYNKHHVSLPPSYFSNNNNNGATRFHPNENNWQGQSHNQFKESTKYTSNQFNPYVQTGLSPTPFKPQSTPQEIPHYMKEYLQHHSISNHILARLQNSVRTSRSANLTEEEIESLLEISKKSPSDEELLKNMEVISPLLRKLDLSDESGEEETESFDEKNSTNTDIQPLLNKENRNETDPINEPLTAASNNNVTIENLSEKDDAGINSGRINSERNITEVEIKRTPTDAILDNGGFQAPKTIQRGFVPILPYSEKDPGPMIMKFGPVSTSRNSRALPIDYQQKVLVSLTHQNPSAN